MRKTPENSPKKEREQQPKKQNGRFADSFSAPSLPEEAAPRSRSGRILGLRSSSRQCPHPEGKSRIRRCGPARNEEEREKRDPGDARTHESLIEPCSAHNKANASAGLASRPTHARCLSPLPFGLGERSGLRAHQAAARPPQCIHKIKSSRKQTTHACILVLERNAGLFKVHWASRHKYIDAFSRVYS